MRRNYHKAFLAILFTMASVIMAHPVTAQYYSVADLGPLNADSNHTYAQGINNLGQIVGYYYVVQGNSNVQYAFLYDNGIRKSLLEGAALAINNLGQVVGYSSTPETWHTFLYSEGDVNDLGTLPGGWFSSARAINDVGQIVGGSSSSEAQNRAYLYDNGIMYNLGTLPGDTGSEATGINNLGQVVGMSFTSGGAWHAFLYEGGTMTDLGAPPGFTNSDALGINDAGQIVGGFYNSGDPRHPFLYSGSSMTDLGILPGFESGEAIAINNAGQIVGYLQTSSYGASAFLYESGTMTDLNTLILNSSWHLGQVNDINDLGQIVGFGYHGNDTFIHAFLLTPKASVPVAIDIMPGDLDNELNLKKMRTVTVAILSADGFEAFKDVDQSKLTFGFTGDEVSFKSCSRKAKDVDGDLLKDLVCTFTVKTAFQCNSLGDYTRGILRGQTKAGIPFEGNQELETTPSCIP